jgi:hypothetical protein
MVEGAAQKFDGRAREPSERRWDSSSPGFVEDGDQIPEQCFFPSAEGDHAQDNRVCWGEHPISHKSHSVVYLGTWVK